MKPRRANVAENVLSADSRTATGKGANRKLRVAGHIPGVVYGKGRDAQPVVLDPKALQVLLHQSGAGLNTLIDLSVAGRTNTVLVKELQRHPVHGSYLHVDFFQVDLTQKITVSVPIHFVGKARGVEFGGILDHPLRELEVECLPRAIPEFVEVDVSALEVGQSIHVSDLRLPEGVEVKTDAALPVASVVLPAAEVEATPTETVVEGEVAEGEAAAAAPAETPAKGKGGEGGKGKAE
jgi:large subunit ribosomal protein L25